MSRPIPYVFCPTKVLMDRAIRALYAAGYVSKDRDHIELMDEVPDDESCANSPYLACGTSYGVTAPYLWPCGRGNFWVTNGTRCNSVGHMIAYLKANHGKT